MAAEGTQSYLLSIQQEPHYFYHTQQYLLSGENCTIIPLRPTVLHNNKLIPDFPKKTSVAYSDHIQGLDVWLLIHTKCQSFCILTASCAKTQNITWKRIIYFNVKHLQDHHRYKSQPTKCYWN
jgi:hypothetical protein